MALCSSVQYSLKLFALGKMSPLYVNYSIIGGKGYIATDLQGICVLISLVGLLK